VSETSGKTLVSPFRSSKPTFASLVLKRSFELTRSA
jgi:hypothetical protein